MSRFSPVRWTGLVAALALATIALPLDHAEAQDTRTIRGSQSTLAPAMTAAELAEQARGTDRDRRVNRHLRGTTRLCDAYSGAGAVRQGAVYRACQRARYAELDPDFRYDPGFRIPRGRRVGGYVVVPRYSAAQQLYRQHRIERRRIVERAVLPPSLR